MLAAFNGVTVGAVDGPEHVVANRFRVVNLVQVVVGILPLPFARCCDMIFCDRLGPGNFRKADPFFGSASCPNNDTKLISHIVGGVV